MTTGPFRDTVHDRERSAGIVAGGSIAEAVGGLAAVVLSILGLIGFNPFLMLTVGGMAVGLALMAQGGAIAAGLSRLLARGDTREQATIGGGITAEFLGGLAGFICSLLALLGIQEDILAPVALMIFGGSILLGSGSTAELNRLAMRRFYETREHERRMPGERERTIEEQERTIEGGTYEVHREREFGYEREPGYDRTTDDIVRQSVNASSGAQVLVGLAAITLSILALMGFNPMTLTLCGILAVGASILLTGTTLATRLMRIISH